MAPRALAYVLAAWALATALACVLVRHAFALDLDAARPGVVVASAWRGGELVARAVLPHPGDRDTAFDAVASGPGVTRVEERVVGEGPVVAWPEAALSLSFVPGREGLVARLDGRTAYVTPDELFSMQAYDHGIAVPSMQLSAGLDLPFAYARAAERLGVTVPELRARASLRRFQVERVVVAPAPAPPRAITPDALDLADVRAGAIGMGRYLARGVDDAGRFRYLVNATTNQTLPGYDWPRHAGATYFVAQIAALTGDADVRFAALRAAGQLRDHAMIACGDRRCIGEAGASEADLGSTALAVLAFVEIARTHLDDGYALVVPQLTDFIRSQQRPDGELMHVYDRRERHPIDVQLLYYSGEAAFALARAHGLGGDPRDLDAATRALAHLAGPAWSFFGSRYYWGEEHWTCQAMDELWGRAPAATLDGALDFCLGWQAYGRQLMYGPGDTPFDADGAYGAGPVFTPHLTPAGSRAEAGIATLEAARRAGRPAAQTAVLEGQMRRSLAMLLRHQLGADRAYLFADPVAVEGAMPGSDVDWQLRIDYAQHTGSALLRWLALVPPS